MNKADIANELHASLGITKNQKDAKTLVDGVFNLIADALVDEEDVTIGGFGIFSTSERPAHTARNPKTGEPIEVPTRYGVRFKPAAALKRDLNEGEPVVKEQRD